MQVSEFTGVYVRIGCESQVYTSVCWNTSSPAPLRSAFCRPSTIHSLLPPSKKRAALVKYLKRRCHFATWYSPLRLNIYREKTGKKRSAGIMLLLFGISEHLNSLTCHLSYFLSPVFASSSGLEPEVFAFKGCCSVWPQCSVLLNAAFVKTNTAISKDPWDVIQVEETYTSSCLTLAFEASILQHQLSGWDKFLLFWVQTNIFGMCNSKSWRLGQNWIIRWAAGRQNWLLGNSGLVHLDINCDFDITNRRAIFTGQPRLQAFTVSFQHTLSSNSSGLFRKNFQGKLKGWGVLHNFKIKIKIHRD